MSEIQELRLLGQSALFNESDSYIVPLYQRAYAWEEKEILQLLHDIRDMDKEEETYYLGSLIVAELHSTYEVIDGQQRLTTLFMLLKCMRKLGWIEEEIPAALRFSCRDRSNYTLQNLTELALDERVEESIKVGRDIIMEELKKTAPHKDAFLENLKKVVLYRISVPERTDLNRYFEIMNTRGEQLEQHDILKASLMSALSDPRERAAFAQIWEACSDMTGYVQMHFPVKAREALFGTRWWDSPKYERLSDLSTVSSENDASVTIAQIVKDDFKIERYDGTGENDEHIRFESIIDFPYFLLHVLKVYVTNADIGGEALLDELLDDKKLVRAFERIMENGSFGEEPIREHKADFTRGFIECLLQCRFLFDKYIIKREFAKEDLEGSWSLKELKCSDKKAYYVETNFAKAGEWCRTKERRTKNNLMLQACFRVSYTSPKVMHWITELLKWLTKPLSDITAYEAVSEELAKKAVKRDFLDGENYNLGVNTPHIVFNYLDYLLWRDAKQQPDFTFEFRNSVEHWYPQNPSEDSFPRWSREDGVDGFGNLCLMQRRENSKFSNLSPDSKKSTYEETIRKGSLKLRAMSELTVVPANGKAASAHWREEACRKHGAEMIELLQKACK